MHALRLITGCIVAVGTASCCGDATERRGSLSRESVVSARTAPGKPVLVVERFYTGGATGDTLHNAWVCAKELSDCAKVGIIDTDDGPPPAFDFVDGTPTITLSATDVIWDFANVTALPAPAELVRVTIRYQEKGLPAK